MSVLDDLTDKIDNEELRASIKQEISKLSGSKKFGLVFEEHHEFSEAIYPGLERIDEVSNDPGGDLWHVLIEAENYHALQLLEYTCAGQADCIYIDPPYNTGARDWKYNNDYVDANDAYRHSKWLSFMAHRLELARRLLSHSGCIFISIDDGEACRLKLLCDDIFGVNSFVAQIPWRKRTAKSDVPFGISQDYESILCYANPGFRAALESNGRKYYETPDFPGRPWRFHDLTTQKTASQRPNSNFTIIHPITGDEYPPNPNRLWAITHETFAEYYNAGRIIFPGDYDFLKISKPVLRYWKEDDERKAGGNFGLISVSTKLPDSVGMTQDGTKELTAIFGDKRFSFPKPVQLIKYLVNIATVKKPNATIIDFFAGSGTTLHAVNLLNAQDSGHRRCIMITNNEISDSESRRLTAQGYSQDSPEWQNLGIARHVTWPRTVCTISGHDINGQPLKGSYLDSDIPMSDGFRSNAVFFRLVFSDRDSAALGHKFREILPVLWMKAGMHGRCPAVYGDDAPDMLILPENRFAVINNEKIFPAFIEEVNSKPEIETVFIAADSDTSFLAMSEYLNARETCQLYRDYLDNFRINQARS